MELLLNRHHVFFFCYWQRQDEDENLPADELKRKVERLSRQSAQMLTQLALSDLQLRALNLGQVRTDAESNVVPLRCLQWIP